MWDVLCVFDFCLVRSFSIVLLAATFDLLVPEFHVDVDLIFFFLIKFL